MGCARYRTENRWEDHPSKRQLHGPGELEVGANGKTQIIKSANRYKRIKNYLLRTFFIYT